jgi:carbamoyl-phosphate synthase large subunit
VQVSGDSPVLIDRYLRDAIEVDVDALCDGDDVVVAGVLQHIEEAGVHSGDSACSIPPYSLSAEIIAEIERQTEVLARALEVRGLMNIQFAVKDDEVYLIEVNPRASRTVPFVAKAIGSPIAKIAARVMAGEKLADLPKIDRDIKHVAVKEAVFPFARFPGVDPVLSPEMKSTGEVMGIDSNFATAFAKAQLGAGTCCRPAAACSSRSRTATSRHPARRAASLRAGASPSSRPAAPRIIWRPRGSVERKSTRWPRGGRISSTGSRMAMSR